MNAEVVFQTRKLFLSGGRRENLRTIVEKNEGIVFFVLSWRRKLNVLNICSTENHCILE